MGVLVRSYVIVATKGRSKEVGVLLDLLAQQTERPVHTYVVGSETGDIEGLDAAQWLMRTRRP